MTQKYSKNILDCNFYGTIKDKNLIFGIVDIYKL